LSQIRLPFAALPVSIKQPTEAGIRRFLLDKYREPIGALGLIPEELADDFDFLLNGVIDSFGILEMISAIEKEFEIELDLEALDAEHITILGPLSRYVAERGCFRNMPNSDGPSS
jgi:acyl carrier protein